MKLVIFSLIMLSLAFVPQSLWLPLPGGKNAVSSARCVIVLPTRPTVAVSFRVPYNTRLSSQRNYSPFPNKP